MLRTMVVSGACIISHSALAGIPIANLPVQAYGVLDFGAKYSHSDAGDDHGFQSGMGSTSRIGLKLDAKVNDDIEIIGALESGIDLKEFEFLKDTTFNRAANIGIQSKKYGTLLYGRQYNAAIGLDDDPFLGVSAYSPFVSVGASSSGLGAGSLSMESRASRAISYTTPNIQNIKTQVLYTPNQAIGPHGIDAENYGLMSIYDDGINRLGFSYNELINNNAVVYNNKTYSNVKTRLFHSTIGHTFNQVLKLSSGFAYFKPDSPNAVSAQIYNIGVVYNQAKYSLRSAIYYREVDQQDKAATAFSIGGEYHINKYLDAYVRSGYVFNNEKSKYTVNSTIVDENGDDPSSYATGLRFRF